ncbi:hypothetical protein ABTZ03_02970 [Kitasatospora sp. NPDC096077]|uniref:hypothetical protein n=1 Tax=Kitasatospora sp. NPDC096077 TaxID=3155544 RepID=UPI00332C5DB2
MVDKFFAVPMALLAVTFPLFKFGSESVRNGIGWPCLGVGLVLTVTGLLFCARSRRSPGPGGISCLVAAAVIGSLAVVRYGLPL